MKRLFLLLVSSFLLFSLSYGANPQKPLEFAVKTIDDKTLHATELKNGIAFKEFEGKVVLLEFWGTHCPPCLYSIEHYKKLMNEYKDKVAMLAIEVQMTPKEQLKKFVQEKGINYYIGTQEDNMEFVQYISARAGWRGAIPFLIILDTKGNVIDIKTGYADEQYVKSIIDYALKKASAKK